MALSTVHTQYGVICGLAREGYSEFRGIPYAAPPVGELRWKAPQPPAPWQGEYQAVKFPAQSMQKKRPSALYDKEFRDDERWLFPSSEDSLYLNIWTPAETGQEALPVVFWIHGGAFMGGCGGEKEFDGKRFCEKKVILVTVNYRLNLFGFLAHPWLTEESPHHVSGNYGILDQIAALRWVRENISAFGGDPENITVMGQSAGAMSVQTLVSSPLTENWISKAILQSGGGYQNGMNEDVSLQEAEKLGAIFVEETGATSLKELRSQTPEQLYAAFGSFMEKISKLHSGLPMLPVVDGYVLPEGYNAQVENGTVKKIPYLLGSNLDDIFVSPEETAAGQKSKLYQGCVAWSQKLESAGFPPAYVYFFTRRLPGDDAGAFHSAELWYMFGTLERCWRPFTEHDYRLSEAMVSYWANFIRSGNPNGEGLPQWKPCTISGGDVLELG